MPDVVGALPVGLAPQFLCEGVAMGRGRAKAKQTKVARELKYNSPNTDLAALQRELSGRGTSDGDGDERVDLVDDDADEDDSDDGTWDDGTWASRGTSGRR
jgi:hypothetical protein